MGKDRQRVICRMNRQILTPCVFGAVLRRGLAFGARALQRMFNYFVLFLVLVLFVMPEKINSREDRRSQEQSLFLESI